MSQKTSKRSASSKRKVINVRGTGGSGKSHLVVSFMKKYGAMPIRKASSSDDLFNAGGKVEAYLVDYKGQRVYVIGRYETATGGCDGIKTQLEVCGRVLKYVRLGSVIFEGFLISGLYQRYRLLSRRVGGTYWCYLDTPLEKCINRISSRNKGKEFDTSNTAAKYKATQATKRKAEADGEKVFNIRHKDALEDLCRVLDYD